MELIAVLDSVADRSLEMHEMAGVASELGLEHTLYVLVTPVSEDEFIHPEQTSGLLRISLRDAVRVA